MLCDFTAEGMRCPAEAAPGETKCAVHRRYRLNAAKVKCNRCTKTISAGQWTMNDERGNVVHAKPCKAPPPQAPAKPTGR